MRRFVPWLLLGVLGLVTGLGLGLGLAYGGTTTSRTATPALLRLVPTWVPPGNGPSSHVIALTFGLPERCHATPSRTVSSPDGSQSFTYLTTTCRLGIGLPSHRVEVGSRRVTIAEWGRAVTAFTAVWTERPGTYVQVGGFNVSEAQMERFIVGLRVAYPSSLHHH